jgi:fatty-acyl-CoA synthase
VSQPALTIPALVRRAATVHPEHDSFVFPERRESYAQLYQAATEVAASLTALGIGPGDTVGLLMPNCFEFAHALIGTAMVGALVVPVNARLSPREIAHVAADSGMCLMFTTDAADEHVDFAARLYAAFPGLADAADPGALTLPTAPALRRVVLLGRKSPAGLTGPAEFADLARGTDREAVRAAADRVDPDWPYIMMYTSGTTALPKGCPLSHRAVVGLGIAVGEECFGVTDDDRMWNPLPMFHVSAQAPMVGILNGAAAYISMPHFEVTAALDLIARERATILFPAYPTLTGPLLGHPDYRPDTFAGVRAMLTVGPPDLLRTYQAKLPHTAHVSCYGSTETGGIPVMGRLDDPLEQRVTSGRPFSGIELRIRDPLTGKEQPAGESGAIHVRGYNLFLGYHNDPEKTAESFDDEGWFSTGDLGSVDEWGNLTFRGRAKDMLKVGGENVGCLEVESYLLTHPDITVAAVFGIPDAKYGELPAAFVELRPGASLTEDDVVAHCRAGLARYKVPRFVRFTTEWPMSATKIQKYLLREQLLGELPDTVQVETK